MATDLLKNLAYLAMNWAQLAIDPGKLCYLAMDTITYILRPWDKQQS